MLKPSNSVIRWPIGWPVSIDILRSNGDLSQRTGLSLVPPFIEPGNKTTLYGEQDPVSLSVDWVAANAASVTTSKGLITHLLLKTGYPKQPGHHRSGFFAKSLLGGSEAVLLV